MAEVENSNAGRKLNCSRCAKPCVIADTRKSDARFAVEANGEGLCAECIVTALLKQVVGEGDPHGDGWFAAFKPEHLRLAHVQQQMQAVVNAAGSRLPAAALDWDEVIANWDLPVPKRHKDQLF